MEKLTGIELIAQERREQIEKHGRTVDKDVLLNNNGELLQAARALTMEASDYRDFAQVAVRLSNMPNSWDTEICRRMAEKPHKDRLIISGALIMAEIDRLKVEIERIAAEIDRLQALEG